MIGENDTKMEHDNLVGQEYQLATRIMCMMRREVDTKMKHADLVEWVDQLETSLSRAEMYKKDIDLIVCLRLLYTIMKERLKEDGSSRSSKL